jgi:hypothetical protein
MKDYEFLLEDMVLHSKSLKFHTAQYIRERLTLFLKSQLLVLLKEYSPLEEIKDVLTKAEKLSLDVKDEHLAKELSLYIKRSVLKASEEELLELLEFTKNYNLSVSRYELYIDVWELQNIIWERRQDIKNKRVFELLNLAPSL